MKLTLSAAAVCVLLIAASGCNKKEEAVTAPAPQAQDTAPGAAEKAVTAAQAQTEAVKQAVQGTVTNVQAQADAATGKGQGIIDNAKKLIGENKWSEALALLNSLSGQQLSPDQQSLVQSLKEQAQKAIAAATATKTTDEAAKSVGGLLQPKK